MKRPQPRTPAHPPKPGLEMLLFLAVSAAGIYALGSGLRAVFEPGAGVDLGWLAVAGAAMWILFSQNCRVHDSWPRRLGSRHGRASPGGAKTGVAETSLTSSGDDPREAS